MSEKAPPLGTFLDAERGLPMIRAAVAEGWVLSNEWASELVAHVQALEARITELQAYNTAEVEKRREAERQAQFAQDEAGTVRRHYLHEKAGRARAEAARAQLRQQVLLLAEAGDVAVVMLRGHLTKPEGEYAPDDMSEPIRSIRDLRAAIAAARE